MKIDRSSDPIWWALAAVLGLGALSLPQWLRLTDDGTSRTLMVQGGLFFAGCLMGALRPRRVWRWPVACFLAFGFADLALLANNPKFTWSSDELTAQLLKNASLYFVHTLPVLVGTYLGCYLSKEGTE